MRRQLDFFSGLGGFSEAAHQSDKWEVLRIDNDPQFEDVPNTIIADIMKCDHKMFEELGWMNPDLMSLSPPCQCFSLMAVYHYWENGKPKNDKTRFAISLVKRSLELKNLIKPDYWVLENPNGMMKKVLGKPHRYTWWGSWYSEVDHLMIKLKERGVELPPMKPTSLWGILPDIKWRPKPKKGEYQPAPRGAKTGIQDKNLTPEERSCIPFEFSQAMIDAVDADTGGQLQLC